ncbi:MAG: O-antigen ligase family protein [Solirubrobacteraceae bacterium]
MSTFELSPEGRPALGARVAARVRAAAAGAGPGELLLGALLLLVLYAAFAHGATAQPAEPRLQVATAAVAAIAVGIWVWSGGLRLRISRAGWVGIALLGAFALWSGVSLAWSVSPDRTWTELNRYVMYTVVLLLAMLAGSSASRAAERLQSGYLAIALLITAYALGQKFLPGLHVGGVFDLNQTGAVPRLQMPFGYWNALSLFLSMAVPLALALCLDQGQSPSMRLGALVSLELMFLVIGLTYSRGGLLALALGVVVMLTLGGGRLRGLMWLAAAGVAVVVPLVLGLSSRVLTTPKVSLSDRQTTGAEFAAVVVVSAVALIIAGRRLLLLEHTVTISAARRRGIVRGLAALVGLAVIVALLAATVSHRGLTGTISHAWDSFTTAKTVSNTNPNRLLSDNFGDRVLWWKEAAGAFSSRPLGGWGAGSFRVVHLLFRRNGLSVAQPHSVPLQFLAETGIVGALLALGAFAALLVAAWRAVRGIRNRRERIVAAALFGAAAAYVLHACYDWDSDIPGVTLPMLAFLGVLAGRPSETRRPNGPSAEHAYLPVVPAGARIAGAGAGVRIVAIVAAALAACAFAVSAALPSLAADKFNAASVTATAGSAQALARADRQAALVTRLDPVTDSGLWLQANIALRLAQESTGHASRYYRRAQVLLAAALARDPSDINTWVSVVQVELFTRHYQAALAAAQRVLNLDPEGQQSFYAGAVAQEAAVLLAPPQGSATAVQTP